MVPKFGGTNLDLAPGSPRMLVDVGFDIRNYDPCAFHHATADQNHLGIVRMNQADGRRRPNVETAVLDRNGDLVATCSFFKKLFEPDLRISRQHAFCSSGPSPYYQGK